MTGLTLLYNLYLNSSSHNSLLLWSSIAVSVCVDVSSFLSSTAASDETVRTVERGSRLICAVAMDTKVILQMPRGNLEVIHPRSLVLAAAHNFLDRFISSFSRVDHFTQLSK